LSRGGHRTGLPSRQWRPLPVQTQTVLNPLAGPARIIDDARHRS
jgi:hypothetical protein